jgi:hypothetical protein
MDELPIWMKLPIWIVVGATVLYAVTMVLRSLMS